MTLKHGFYLLQAHRILRMRRLAAKAVSRACVGSYRLLALQLALWRRESLSHVVLDT